MQFEVKKVQVGCPNKYRSKGSILEVEEKLDLVVMVLDKVGGDACFLKVIVHGVEIEVFKDLTHIPAQLLFEGVQRELEGDLASITWMAKHQKSFSSGGILGAGVTNA